VSETGTLDIAGFFAHPDDAELVVGGSLARAAAAGRRLALVDLTRGESGSRGTPETRATEAIEGARILGVAHRESLGLPDASLALVAAQKDPIVEAIRRLRPRTVLLPHWEQRHPDHRAASQLVYDAAFLAGLRHYRSDLGEPFRPFKLVYALSVTDTFHVTPSFVVDVTPFWETKLRAIRAFASQFPDRPDALLPLDRFQASVEAGGRREGQRIGVTYGEGFVTREPLEVDDLAGMAVSSF
jgi:N-acetylglucosamine malate deacetylase 1